MSKSKGLKLKVVLNPYTAERRDVLENTPPRPKRFPKGGDFATKGTKLNFTNFNMTQIILQGVF